METTCPVLLLTSLILLVESISCEIYAVREAKNPMNHTHEKWYNLGVLPEEEPPYAIIFICGTFALGVVIRCLWRLLRVKLPYSVFLFAVGCLLGWLAGLFEEVHNYTGSICDMSPKYILMIFLPVFIFQTAFSMEVNTFKRGLRQIILISVIGFLITTILTATMIKYMNLEDWSWEVAIMFGAIANTCYSQNVVTLLRGIGHSKQLSTLIEGEGLLTDASAIVVFNILLGYITGYITTALHIWVLCLMFIAGGPLLGFVIGKLSALILSSIFNDIISMVTITLVVTYLSYYVAEQVLGLSGVLCIVVIGLVISAERMKFNSEVDYFLQLFWEILSFFASTLIFMMVGVIILEVITGKIASKYLFNSVLIYLTCLLSRTIMYLIMNGIFKCFRCSIPLKNVAVIIWGGLRGAVCLSLALVVEKAEGLEDEGPKFLIYASALVLLTHLINGCTLTCVLKALGMLEVSAAKRANMNSTVKYLSMMRDRALNMVKMDRHLAGANWIIVEQATQIKHPYKINVEMPDDVMDGFLGYHTAFCPECQQEVHTEPTKAEYVEMRKEANLRILKAKKVIVSYRRQYEHGMLSKEAIHILVTAVEVASDRENPIMEIDDLKDFWTRRRFAEYIRKKLVAIMIHTISYYEPSANRLKSKCYKIVVSKWFEYFLFIIIILNIISVSLEIYFDPMPRTQIYLCMMIVNHIFWAIFLTELVLKCCAFGCCLYLKSFLNVLDLTILIVSTLDLLMDYLELYYLFYHNTILGTIWHTAMRVFQFLRLLRIIRLCKAFLPKLIIHLDSLLDVHLRRSFDVGKGFVIGEEEILKLLMQIVENKKIYVQMKEKIEDDRIAVSRKLGIMQKDYPDIAITVKTRQAIRIVLYKLKIAVADIKNNGLLDDFEYKKCIDIVEGNLNYLRTHCQNIEPCPPLVLLQQVSWIVGDSVVEAFLFENSKPINFNYGEVIIAHKDIPESLYIIVYGVVKQVYEPSKETIKNLKQYGALPNVDYFNTLHFEESQEEYLLSGNVLGELGILTGRLYDTTTSCETSVQAYEVPLRVIVQAMSLSPDKSTGLRARMWKTVALRIAHVILTNTPHYQSWTQDDIKYYLEKAFVPTLSQYSIFTVTELIQDILLIEGQIMDLNSRIVYYAPCYVPRTVQKFIFPKNSLMNVITPIDTKLLIIPVEHCDELDVVEDGKGIKITSSLSGRCLQHSVQSVRPKQFSQRTLKSEYGKQLGHEGHTSTYSVHSLLSNAKVFDVTAIASLSKSSRDFSEYNEKVQNIIEPSSWTTLSERRTLPSLSLPSIESGIGQKQVKFVSDSEKEKVATPSQYSLDEAPRRTESSSFSEEIVNTPKKTHDVNNENSQPEQEIAKEKLILPYKRMFMTDLREEEKRREWGEEEED